MNDPIPIFGQSGSGKRTPFRPLRLLAGILAIIVFIGIGGFIQFVLEIPEPTDPAAQTAPMDVDALVVLTGDRDRIMSAVQLLENGSGARLLISGVNTDISREDLATQFGGPDTRFDCCVDLGFRARTTVGNADETSKWVSEKGYTSLAVVTSDYHMPRSLVLLRNEMPDVTLLPEIGRASCRERV